MSCSDAPQIRFDSKMSPVPSSCGEIEALERDE
jgi:hypothetical protein